MAVAKNDVTGDSIQTKIASKEFDENYEAIFGKRKKKRDDEYWAKLEAETKKKLESE